MKLEFSCMDDQDITHILLNTTQCHLNYNKSKWYQYIVNTLTGIVGKKYKTEVSALVTNVSRSLKLKCDGFKLTLNNNRYSYNKLSYKRMIELLDKLEHEGYIDIYIGGWCKDYEKLPPSCILFNSKLVNLWDKRDIADMKLELPVNEIRDRETKQVKCNKGFRGIKQMNDKLDIFNKQILEHLISLNGKPVPSVMYKRVFIDDLTKGGRYYDAGSSVQTLSQKVRAGIKIDGEETIELDMVANHPSFAYERAGIKMEKDFQPYDISEFYDVPCDWDLVKQHRIDIDNPKYDPVRNIAKYALLVCINCRDDRQALGAVSLAIGQDKKKPLEHRKYLGLERVSSREICNGIINQNYMIEDVFYSDYGVIYQNLDSKIAEYVVDSFLQDDEIVLIWHDSFRCKVSLEDKLRETMIAGYKKILGTTLNCRLEKK